jgi:hypothetical protein
MICLNCKKTSAVQAEVFLQGRVEKEEDGRISSPINSGKSGQEIKFSGFPQSQNNFF